MHAWVQHPCRAQPPAERAECLHACMFWVDAGSRSLEQMMYASLRRWRQSAQSVQSAQSARQPRRERGSGCVIICLPACSAPTTPHTCIAPAACWRFPPAKHQHLPA
jgi:hypothetical protein